MSVGLPDGGSAGSSAMNGDADLSERLQRHRWFHSIELPGLSISGDSPASELLAAPGVIPDVRGKSVLDIGAWDGKYSFQAEAAGAARVVALDHYVWRLDPSARQEYYEQCRAYGVLPDPGRIARGFLNTDSTPGKAGFDLLHEHLASNVVAVVDDFMTMDLAELGTFDVVFYFGVLYHLTDPITALQRVRQVTQELAIIETAGIRLAGYRHSSVVEFYPGDELNEDFGNWFAPSASALVAMCRVAGFRRVELKAQSQPRVLDRLRQRYRQHRPAPCRFVVHAYP